MSTPSEALRPPVPVHPPVLVPPKQSLYWSVRRELWENRSIYIAPLSVAAVILFGFVMSTIGLPHRRRATLLLDPAQQRLRIEQPYIFAAGMLVITAFLVGFFYCLDALHGERRTAASCSGSRCRFPIGRPSCRRLRSRWSSCRLSFSPSSSRCRSTCSC